MKEKWSRYKINEIPKGKYELFKIEQNWNGTFIILDDEINKITISFESSVLAMRSCDEGDRWRTIGEVLGENGGDFFVGNPLYIVNDSEFSSWYNKETFEANRDYTHYAIVTQNDVIDILSMVEPDIKVEKI